MLDATMDTPPSISEQLSDWGGKNEFGQPLWRLILAQNHLVQRFGQWIERGADFTDQVEFESVVAEGHKPIHQFKSRQVAPENITHGMKWVPRYPVMGWIVERWFPASAFGSRDAWENALSEDGTPMMGPFPEHGGYYMMLGPWEEIPSLDAIRQQISTYENSKHLHGVMDEDKIFESLRQAEKDADDREEQIYLSFLREADYAVKHNLEFIKGNPALSKFRNKIASDTGLNMQL